MDPLVSGSSVVNGAFQVVWGQLRHVLEVCAWALVVALAGAAGCWCCGYAARNAWLKAGPPARRPRHGRARPGDDPVTEVIDLTVAEEAERGIRELEAYLDSVRPARPEAPGTESGETPGP